MRSVTGLLALLPFSVYSLAAVASCMDSQYIGFDSRVTARIIGRLPVTDDLVAGFAVAGGRPVVLLGKRLLIYDSGVPREIALPYPATGLSVDSRERIRIQHGETVDLVTTDTVTTDPEIISKGKLFGSGRPVLLDTYAEDGVQKFILERSKDDIFGLAGARGDFRAAFW